MLHHDHEGKFIGHSGNYMEPDVHDAHTSSHTQAVVDDLERHYISVREKEGRIYADELVRKLPLIDKTEEYFKEWELRLIATLRLHKYLMDKGQTLKILDIGCGNGWFANLMTQIYDSQVHGIDINQRELDQAHRIFGSNPDLHLSRHDITTQDYPEKDFDVIILAATVQYFRDLPEVIEGLFSYLSDKGEIHIIDSPFYQKDELKFAQKRSERYYANIAVPEMAKYYHHHSLSSLDRFNYLLKYDPRSLINKVRRKILTSADSPFPWVVLQKARQNG